MNSSFYKFYMRNHLNEGALVCYVHFCLQTYSNSKRTTFWSVGEIYHSLYACSQTPNFEYFDKSFWRDRRAEKKKCCENQCYKMCPQHCVPSLWSIPWHELSYCNVKKDMNKHLYGHLFCIRIEKKICIPKKTFLGAVTLGPSEISLLLSG